MKFIHKLLVFVFLSFFSVSVISLVIQEMTFKDLGYESMTVEEGEKSQCFNVSFLSPKMTADSFLVISIHHEFSPVLTGKATIELSLNEKPLETIKANEDFCTNNNCWKRIVVEKTELKEDNKLKICLNSSNSIPIVRVFNDSSIGTYKMPYFKKEDFIQEASNLTPQAGETIRIKIKFKNVGSEDAYVNLRHAKEFVEERMRKEVKEIGDTYFSGIVKAGEEKSFEYRLLIRQPTKMTIPASVLTYINTFGEETSIVSNEIDLNAIEPQKGIFSYIRIKEIRGNTISAELRLINTSPLISFHDITAAVQPITSQEGLYFDKQIFTIGELKASESISMPFTIIAKEKKDFIIFCEVRVAESTEKSYCTENIEFDTIVLDQRIIFGGIFALIGGIIYFYFFFHKKNEKTKA